MLSYWIISLDLMKLIWSSPFHFVKIHSKTSTFGLSLFFLIPNKGRVHIWLYRVGLYHLWYKGVLIACLAKHHIVLTTTWGTTKVLQNKPCWERKFRLAILLLSSQVVLFLDLKTWWRLTLSVKNKMCWKP